MNIICSKGHQVTLGHSFCSHCGEAVSGINTPTAATGNRFQLPLAPQTKLRQFTIHRQIGQGGFGRTYLAVDTSRFNEQVVIKEFAPLVYGTKALKKVGF